MKTQRLFELLVVGGGLWMVGAGCGGDVTSSPGPEGALSGQNGQVVTDGGTSAGNNGSNNGGGGSHFW